MKQNIFWFLGFEKD